MIMHNVKSGQRLPIPTEANAPKALVNLIARCWDHEPSKRPRMPEVVAELEKMLPEGTPVLLPTAGMLCVSSHHVRVNHDFLRRSTNEIAAPDS